jgi:DNA-binding NarL/FixJ family response regulator
VSTSPQRQQTDCELCPGGPATEPDSVRDHELGLIEQLLDGRRPRVRALVVVGEPGIGKSWLLDEIGCRAASRGWRVTRGQATEYEREVPFSVVAEALLPLATGMSGPAEAPLRQVRQRVDAFLSPPGGLGTAGTSRSAAHRTLRDLFAHASARGDLAVLFDDLHWADDASVELMSHLLRQPPELTQRSLLVLAYRPHQIRGRLVTAIETARAAGTAVRVDLGPLNESQAARLLGSGFSVTRTRQLHRASGGNPLYLHAQARSAGPDWLADVPRDLATALAADLATASPDTRATARAAAILGSSVEPETVCHVADLPTRAVRDALDELCARDVLRPDTLPGMLRFRHPMLRHVVYEDTPPAWRRSAHARAAELLSARAAPVTLWAHHVERSATAGDMAAVSVLVRAAAAVRSTAPAIAANWYAAAMRLLPADAATADRCRLQLALAESLALAGQLREARWAVGQARSGLPGDRPLLRRRVVLSAVRLEQHLGQDDEAAAMLRRELDGQDGRSPVLVPDNPLRIELAATEVMRGDFLGAVREAEAVRGVAATAILALARYAAGETAAAVAACDAAGVAIDGLYDAELARHLPSVVWLGWAETSLGRYPTALRRQHRAVGVARSTGQIFLLGQLLVGQGDALRCVGQLQEARECFDEALEVARLAGSDALARMALTMQCRLQTWLGDTVAAVRAGSEAVSLAGRAGGWFAVLAPVALAQARLEAGQAHGCIAAVLDAAGGAELPRLDLGGRAACYELLTRAALAVEDREQAADWANRAGIAATRAGLPVATAFADLALARVMLDEHAPAAAQRADRAAQAFDALRNPLDAARARMVGGQALAAAGSRQAALTVIAAAEADFTRSGAERLRAEAVRELRRLGRHMPAVGSKTLSRHALVGVQGIEDLTPREQEVAGLVAQGRTNRQIATDLFLSEKTIERHLGNTYLKLRIPSRAALAARVGARAVGHVRDSPDARHGRPLET